MTDEPTVREQYDYYRDGYATGYQDATKDRRGDKAVFKTPDLTPAQGVAIVGAILAVAASFGFDLSQSQQDSIMQLVSIVAAVLLVGDAVIRHGRATGDAKKVD